MEQTLGKRIVQNRKRLGLTQDQLAEQLGVTAQAVSKWENDQSCPDISILPKLAQIFGTTTDALLGRETEAPTYIREDAPAQEPAEDPETANTWEFTYDNSKRTTLGFGIWVLGTGVLLLAAKLLQKNASLWDILWPTALVVFGLFGLIGRFSFFRGGCLLFGGYFLLDNLELLPFTLGSELILPAILVLFGVSLLADALKKPKKPKFHVSYNPSHKSGRKNGSLNIDEESFSYSASFGECSQRVEMPRLSEGSISTSFGEYTVDLSGVESVAEGCCVSANCSFGELIVLVPSRYKVRSHNAASFAQVQLSGHPDPDATQIIDIDAHASFGEICIRYV